MDIHAFWKIYIFLQAVILFTVLCFQEMLEKCMENERERNKEALAAAAKVS